MALIKEILKRAEKSEKAEDHEENDPSPMSEQEEKPQEAEKSARTKKTDKAQKSVRTETFMKELLSGTMVSEKIILKNLGYVAFSPGAIHRQQV
jgi:hypothetical protein